MLNLLAQSYDYTYTTTEVSTGDAAGLALFSGFFIVLYLIIIAFWVVALWKTFEKAGVEGWKAIIPIYNVWVLCEIVGRPGWWVLILLATSWIPFIGAIISLGFSVVISIDTAKSFGKEPIWALLFFLGIGYLLTGFDKNTKYVGPGGKPKSGGAPKAPAAA